MRKFLLIVFSALLTISASAQSRSETKQYEKIQKSPSVSLIDKFLKKYPESFYLTEVNAIRDTLLNITPFTNEEAKDIMAQFITSGEYISFPVREEGVDIIYSIQLKDSNYTFYNAVLEVQGKNSNWKITERESFETNMDEVGDLENNSIQGEIQVIKDAKYLICNYIYGNKQVEDLVPGQKERCVYLSFCPRTRQFAELVFSGTTIREGDSLKIEGTRNSSLYGQSRLDVNLISYKMDNNPLLKRLSNDVVLSDLAVEDWLNANPNAMNGATKIVMYALPKEASLIELFEKATKTNSSKYSAAIIDVRGWTVIVVKQKSSGEYLLAWAEPECKNHKTDRLLNSLSFNDNRTLKMSYYHGNKTFSYNLNLVTKVITR